MTPFQSLTIPFSPLSLGICRLADCIFTPKSVFSLWDAGHAFVVSHSLESLNCPRLFSWIPQSNEENPKVKARGPTAKAWTHCPPVTCGTDGRLFSTPAETDAQWTQSDTEEKRGGTTESRGRIRFIGRVQCIQKECRTTRHISVQNLHRWREMEANADYEEREKSDEKGFVFSTTLETSSGRLFRVPITNDLCYKNIANLMKAI